MGHTRPVTLYRSAQALPLASTSLESPSLLQSSVVVLIPRTKNLVLPTSLEARIVGIRLQHDVHAADGDSVHAAYERGDHRGGA